MAEHPILRWFESDHLPQHLQVVVGDFQALAHKIDELSPSAESVTAMRKLLEAKDAAVRAVIHHRDVAAAEGGQ